MKKHRPFLKKKKDSSLNYDELRKLYQFFKKYQRNHPDFNGTKMMLKLYPMIDFSMLDKEFKTTDES